MTDEEMKKRALKQAREQFEGMDLSEYHWGEIAEECADLMVYFAKQLKK